MKNPILKTGIVLGVVAEVWGLIYAMLGWHRNPALAWTFSVLATVFLIVLLVWGLMQTKALGKRYWGQVVSGVLICLVASVIIFLGSLLITSVVFPDLIAESRDMQIDTMAQQGLSEEQIEQRMSMMSWAFTPLAQAISGVIGTVITGFIVSLILAIFIRNKD